MRLLAVLLLIMLALLLWWTTKPADAQQPPIVVKRKAGGLTIDQWRALANKRGEWKRRHQRLSRRRWDPTLLHGIQLAAAAYGQSASALRRVSFCESRFYLYARSSGGHLGPFQFAPSTWRSTPYGGFSPFDPVAAPLAASWMWQQGRKGEWSCR